MATRVGHHTIWQEQVRQLRAVGLSDTDIAVATGAAEQTVRSWGAGTRSPRDAMQYRLASLTELVTRAERLFRHELVLWLKRPVELIDDRTPLAAIGAGDIDELFGLLGGIEDGAFI